MLFNSKHLILWFVLLSVGLNLSQASMPVRCDIIWCSYTNLIHIDFICLFRLKSPFVHLFDEAREQDAPEAVCSLQRIDRPLGLGRVSILLRLFKHETTDFTLRTDLLFYKYMYFITILKIIMHHRSTSIFHVPIFHVHRLGGCFLYKNLSRTKPRILERSWQLICESSSISLKHCLFVLIITSETCKGQASSRACR